MRNNKGFTLIEIMTAMSIFAVVMTISMSSIVGIFDANRRSKAIKDVMSNLNLSMESISKELRYGKNYHCSSSGNITTPADCAEGDSFISFLSSEGEQVVYYLDSSSVWKQVASENVLPVTAPEIVVDDLKFYVLGSTVGDEYQPKVIIKINAHSGNGSNRSDFVLETMVSQRARDI